jgi:Uma2 family endonuclease
MVPIILAEVGEIPPDIVDLDSFRRWARSDEFPEEGRFSYLHGEIWVDLGMEQLLLHNQDKQVKARFNLVLRDLVGDEKLGYFFPDGTRFSSLDVDLSTQPDGLFVSYDAVQDLRVRFIEGAQHGYVEVVGSPEMVLEVVSNKSVQKDTKVLRELYWAAEIPEYWLVDARKGAARFDLLRRGKRGYTAARAQDGWLRSGVFGRSFRLTQQADPLGHPRYTLEVRP